MKKLKIAIFLAMYISSMLSIWYVPVAPHVSLMGNRMKYERNYSINGELDLLINQKPDTGLFIDYPKIYMRLFSIWIATGIAFLICHIIEKKRKIKCEQKYSGDSEVQPRS